MIYAILNETGRTEAREDNTPPAGAIPITPEQAKAIGEGRLVIINGVLTEVLL